MQTFQDTVTLKQWAFDPDVMVTKTAGVYSFATADSTPLAVPATLQPYSGPAPTLTVVVPAQVSRWQAMQIMLATPSKLHPAPATLFDDVQALVTATGGIMLMAWQNQKFILRNGPFVPALKANVGLSDADVDALFIAALAFPE